MEPGLYLISTPIGNSKDITLRAIDVLSIADVIVCEDTRRTKKLLTIHNISIDSRPCIAYHDHSSNNQLQYILDIIRTGKTVAYTSDAGTPLISDPGYEIVKAVTCEHLKVFSIPGPCAAIAALTISGLPTNNFMFIGYPPRKTSQRISFLSKYQSLQTTMVIYESPERVIDTINDLLQVFGNKHATVAREITKRFEEVISGTLQDIGGILGQYVKIKGEIAIIVDTRYTELDSQQIESKDRELDLIIMEYSSKIKSVKDLSTVVSYIHGVRKNTVYKRAIQLLKHTHNALDNKEAYDGEE